MRYDCDKLIVSTTIIDNNLFHDVCSGTSLRIKIELKSNFDGAGAREACVSYSYKNSGYSKIQNQL